MIYNNYICLFIDEIYRNVNTDNDKTFVVAKSVTNLCM